jgi:hypothetical protein
MGWVQTQGVNKMPEDELIPGEPIVEPTPEPIPEPTPEPQPSPAEIESIRQRRQAIIESTDNILGGLEPIIRSEDAVNVLKIAQEEGLDAVIAYLRENIPDVADYLSGISEDASDDVKIKAIKKGLKARAESMVPDYQMPPPFLGNDIEEARSKQDGAATRYTAQYGVVPFVKPVYRGRSAVDNPYYENPNSGGNGRSRLMPETRFRGT